MKKLFKKIHNFFFCLKYPFMKSRNVWTDKFMGYGHTLYDEIPSGWRKAFGKQFLKDLKAALIKDNMLKTFRFTQIKEKYGTLRLYHNGATNEVINVLRRYEQLSANYCINCGKPALYETQGYIQYLCEDCFVKDVELEYKHFKENNPKSRKQFKTFLAEYKKMCYISPEQDETDELDEE